MKEEGSVILVNPKESQVSELKTVDLTFSNFPSHFIPFYFISQT